MKVKNIFIKEHYFFINLKILIINIFYVKIDFNMIFNIKDKKINIKKNYFVRIFIQLFLTIDLFYWIKQINIIKLGIIILLKYIKIIQLQIIFILLNYFYNNNKKLLI